MHLEIGNSPESKCRFEKYCCTTKNWSQWFGLNIPKKVQRAMREENWGLKLGKSPICPGKERANKTGRIRRWKRYWAGWCGNIKGDQFFRMAWSTVLKAGGQSSKVTGESGRCGSADLSPGTPAFPIRVLGSSPSSSVLVIQLTSRRQEAVDDEPNPWFHATHVEYLGGVPRYGIQALACPRASCCEETSQSLVLTFHPSPKLNGVFQKCGNTSESWGLFW